MAWTDPRTWVTGEIVTAAQLNVHLRDNLNAIGPHIRLRKTADETVNNSSVLQNDDHLFFSVAANEVWAVTLRFKITTTATADFKIVWTAPAGASAADREFLTNNGTSGVVWQTASPLTVEAIGGGHVDGDWVWQHFIFVNGGTAGTLQLQWAQNAAEASDTIAKAGSSLIAHRIG